MSQIVTIGQSPFSLTLRLPETGQPEIIAFGPGTSASQSLSHVERSSRVNGMDEAVPSALLLPLGGMGFFGWPAIAGHRQGRDFLLQIHWLDYREKWF